MHATLLAAIFLHSAGGVDSFLELIAMAGPFAIILGLGIWLIVPPIVNAQGERYLFREYRPDLHRLDAEGAGEGNGLNGRRRGMESGHPSAAGVGSRRPPVPRSKLRSN